MKSYEEAVKLEPTMQTAWFGLSHVLNEQDLYEKALQAAAKSIELYKPKVHAPSHNERVFALLKLGRGADALPDIDALTSITPVEQQVCYLSNNNFFLFFVRGAVKIANVLEIKIIIKGRKSSQAVFDCLGSDCRDHDGGWQASRGLFSWVVLIYARQKCIKFNTRGCVFLLKKRRLISTPRPRKPIQRFKTRLITQYP